MASGASEGSPVLLTPGFSGQDLVYWNVFRRRLDRDGWPVFTMTLPGLGLQDIRASAQMLQDRVKEILDATGADRLHLIGHSLGGLVIRAYVQTMGGAADTGVCATLGTPHQGTLTALAAIVRPACRQMLPGSGLIRELDQAPLETPFVNVYSARDSLVVPYSNARYEPAENHQLSFGGHWGLLVRKAAYRPIVQALRRADRSPNGPAT